MIKLNEVYKSYGDQAVLEGFSMSVPDGGRVALMGRSGAGKTTVANLVLGLIKADRGEVEVSGSAAAVFQEDRLIPWLSAYANAAAVLKKPDGGEIKNLLGRLGIGGGLESKPCGELSGGEKRRAAIARAILYRPEILVLDEPFKGIDGAALENVFNVINEFLGGRSLLLITHSEEEAKRLGCEIIKLDK